MIGVSSWDFDIDAVGMVADVEADGIVCAEGIGITWVGDGVSSDTVLTSRGFDLSADAARFGALLSNSCRNSSENPIPASAAAPFKLSLMRQMLGFGSHLFDGRSTMMI